MIITNISVKTTISNFADIDVVVVTLESFVLPSSSDDTDTIESLRLNEDEDDDDDDSDEDDNDDIGII